MHHGVGLIIRNQAKDLFFVQRKDETYPFTKWIGALSTWGGKIEETDASPHEALIREVEEELTFTFDHSKIKFIKQFLVKSDSDYVFNLFELVVEDSTLEHLKHQKVNEGNAELVSKEILLEKDWVWGLEQVIIQYLG